MTFEAALLPDAQKERLCRQLLAEFGAQNLKVSGDELTHSCLLPFNTHSNGDASPSASLNYKKLTYKCLGCGNGGGLLWFIALCRGERTSAARKWLNDQTGAGPDEESLSSLMQFFDAVYGKKNGIKYNPIPHLDMRVLKPWMVIHPYLTEVRGIPEQNLVHFNVGYADDYNTHNRQGERIESKRIIIPLVWRGDLVGWQSRRLLEDGTPKYLSSPDFPKDQSLYNYDAKRDTAVIVESPMSVLSKFHVVPNMEATFGASITDRQTKLIANHRKVIIWLDSDKAGWDATYKLGETLEAFSSVWVVDNPWVADPADMDDETVQRLVADAIPFSLWSVPAELKEWESSAVQ